MLKYVHVEVKQQTDKKSIILKKNKKIHKDWKNIYFTKNNTDYGYFVYQLSLPILQINKQLINQNIESLLDLFGCIRFIAWQTNNDNNNEKIFNDYFYLFEMNQKESNRFTMPFKVSNWLIESIKEIIKKLKSLENNILKDKYFNVICHKPSQIGFHILFIVYKNYNEYANTYEYEFNHNRRINLNSLLYEKFNNYYINNLVFSITYGGASNYKKEKYLHLIKKKKSDKVINNDFRIILKRADSFFIKMKMLQKICKKIKKDIDTCIYYNYNIFVLQNSEILEQHDWKLYDTKYKIEKNDLIYISTYNIRKIIDNSFQQLKVAKEILSFKKSIEFLYYILNNEKCENIVMQVLFEPYNIILDVLEFLNNYFTVKIINFENISFQKDYYYIYLFEMKNKDILIKNLFTILSDIEFKTKVSLNTSNQKIKKKLLKIYSSNL